MGPDPGDSRLINTRVLEDRRVNEVFYPGGMRQERHRHDSACLSFVASGRYEERVGRQAHSRTMVTLISHPAGEKHAVSFESDVRIVSIEFRGNGGTRSNADTSDRGSSHRSELVAWLGDRLRREMARTDSASSLAIDGLISEMLAESSRGNVLREEKRRAAWLTRATDFVQDNFTTVFSLQEVADVAGVHSAHLSRVFRQKMGCTVGEYVRRLRFEFACQQVLSTEKPLCEVAYEAGFADQSHFHRVFLGHVGITPFNYRKLHRR
jgi:AraC family transcriptional regulator